MVNKETALIYSREIAKELSPELRDKLCHLIDCIQVMTFIQTKSGLITYESLEEKIVEYYKI